MKVNHWSGGVALRKMGSSGIAVLLVCEPSETDECKEGYRWSLPGGKCCDGSIIGGRMVNCCLETPEQTLVREVKEETGYDVVPGAIFERQDKVDHKKFFFGLRKISGQQIQKPVPGGKVSPAWFPVNQMPRNLFPSHRRAIQKYVLALTASGPR